MRSVKGTSSTAIVDGGTLPSGNIYLLAPRASGSLGLSKRSTRNVMNPDTWAIIRITSKDGEITDKVLAGWYGGYLSGDSWQLNSGITKVNETDTHYEVLGYSGSIYICRKGLEKLSATTAAILSSLTTKAAQAGAHITLIHMDTLLKERMEEEPLR
jgi:hypothetical protein